MSNRRSGVFLVFEHRMDNICNGCRSGWPIAIALWLDVRVRVKIKMIIFTEAFNRLPWRHDSIMSPYLSSLLLVLSTHIFLFYFLLLWLYTHVDSYISANTRRTNAFVETSRISPSLFSRPSRELTVDLYRQDLVFNSHTLYQWYVS